MRCDLCPLSDPEDTCPEAEGKFGIEHKDGMLGFAVWADQGNTNPLLRAFLRWCDDLAAAKEAA